MLRSRSRAQPKYFSRLDDKQNRTKQDYLEHYLNVFSRADVD
jgi:hypothetical protein